jgi:TonB family protein
MSTTEIPPQVPPEPSAPPLSTEGDLYDSERWQSVYRDLHSTPALLIQTQDELSRTRMREAFWISLVVHLILVIVIVNSPKFEKWFPHRPVLLVSRNSPLQGKDLTFLELPPDAQKITKRPDTNIISDKDRIAMSKKPHLDAKDLRKLLDSAQPGAPGQPTPPAQAAQPASPPALAAPAQPPVRQPTQSAPPTASTDQVAKLRAPAPNPKVLFGTPMTAGSAIEQAARAAAANRGGYSGSGGNYGLGLGRQPTAAMGPMDILSDTMGVDFSPYLSRVLQNVRENWYNLIPEVARAPIMKQGKVTIEFAIEKNGQIAGMRLVSSSGDVALDRAAWGGITASNRFQPLPSEYGGQYLALRFHFFYNPDTNELQ